MSAVNGRVCGGIDLFWLLFNWNSGVLEYLGLAFRLIPPKNLLHLPSTAGAQQASFRVQQPLLAPDAAAESAQFAVAADHAVTGNNHGHRIFIIHVAHGSEGLRAADGAGHIPVGGGLANRI